MKKKNFGKNELNIAMIGQKRVPSREGGVEIVVEELATRMVLAGYKVTCINRGGHHVSGSQYDDCLNRNEYKGVKLITVPTIDKKGMAAMSASFTGAIYAAFNRFDIVHFHAEGPCAMLWLPKFLGKKCVATIHGLDHKRKKWGKLASTYILMGERCAVKYADDIIVLSKGVQDYFWEKYHRKTILIPNGVNQPEIKKPDIINRKYGLKKDDYILFLGRLVPEKGITYLIEAFKKVKTEKKLVIAGGSSDTDEFEKKIKSLAKGDERIIFTGFVQGEELEELYSNAYIYTLPSDLEGMPLSLLEAMSYGNCCLTSDIRECTDVVEDRAVSFEKSNIEDLKEKLEMLCSDGRGVEKIREGVSEFICKKYNWDSVVDKTIDVYKKRS